MLLRSCDRCTLSPSCERCRDIELLLTVTIRFGAIELPYVAKERKKTVKRKPAEVHKEVKAKEVRLPRLAWLGSERYLPRR